MRDKTTYRISVVIVRHDPIEKSQLTDSREVAVAGLGPEFADPGEAMEYFSRVFEAAKAVAVDVDVSEIRMKIQHKQEDGDGSSPASDR